MQSKIDIITLGASTGGTNATEKIFTHLPPNLPPIVFAQHMPMAFTVLYAERLNKYAPFNVLLGEDGMILKSNHAYLAPGNHQMEVISVNNHLQLRITRGERVNLHAPSVDVLFNSLCDIPGLKGIGIILTGMGKDGAVGMKNLHTHGFTTIGQDDSTSVVYGMPRVAFELGAIDYQLPIELIANKIISLL